MYLLVYPYNHKVFPLNQQVSTSNGRAAADASECWRNVLHVQVGKCATRYPRVFEKFQRHVLYRMAVPKNAARNVRSNIGEHFPRTASSSDSAWPSSIGGELK
jgi:hypothetical protein